jgi:hypothetical protein
VSLHVFVDESLRGRYLMAAAMVSPAALTPTRTLLRSLCAPRQRRLRFKTESDARRRAILAQLVGCHAKVRVYTCRSDEVTARAVCLDQLVTDAIADGVQRLVIESREGRDQADRHVIFAALQRAEAPAELTYEHMRPHEEPLLWIADAVAWAYGTSGDWHRRVGPMIDKAVELDA